VSALCFPHHRCGLAEVSRQSTCLCTGRCSCGSTALPKGSFRRPVIAEHRSLCRTHVPHFHQGSALSAMSVLWELARRCINRVALMFSRNDRLGVQSDAPSAACRVLPLRPWRKVARTAPALGNQQPRCMLMGCCGCAEGRITENIAERGEHGRHILAYIFEDFASADMLALWQQTYCGTHRLHCR
jgi:hypothetical protein